MSDEVYCLNETKTGVAVRYNTEAREFKIALTCHPLGKWDVVPEEYKSVECRECGKIYDTEAVAEALRHWATDWIWNYGTRIDDWVAGWTGIPEDDIDVEVDWNE